MRKRPRTPHFISGIGDGNVHDNNKNNDDAFRLRGNNNNKDSIEDGGQATTGIYQLQHHHHDTPENRFGIRSDYSSEHPPDHHYHNEMTRVPDIMNLEMSTGEILKPIKYQADGVGGGGQQISTFTLLGTIVIISAIVLYFVSELSGSPSSSKSQNNRFRNIITSTSPSNYNSRPYQYRRRQRQRRLQKLRKKKTDEWSDDEEARLYSLNDDNILGLAPFSSRAGNRDVNNSDAAGSGDNAFESSPYYEHEHEYDYDYDYDNNDDNNNNNNNNSYVYHESNYYHEPNSHLATQDSRLRRTGATATTSNELYDSYAGNHPAYTYRSPAATKFLMQTTPDSSTTTIRPSTTIQRGISPMNSCNSSGVSSTSRPQRRQNNNISHKSNSNNNQMTFHQNKKSNYSPTNSNSSPYRDVNKINFNHRSTPTTPSSVKTPMSGKLKTSPNPYHQPSLMMRNITDGKTDDVCLSGLGARPLETGSNFSSFSSMSNVVDKINNNPHMMQLLQDKVDGKQQSYNNVSPPFSVTNESLCSSVHSRHQHHQSLLLTPGNSEETPLIGNARKTISIDGDINKSRREAALLPIIGTLDDENNHNRADNQMERFIPYIPSLKTTQGCDADNIIEPPPRSIVMDELRLFEMETGSSTHWSSQQEDFESSFDEADFETKEIERRNHPLSNQRTILDYGSDISIPTGDPRKSIIHKRQNLTMSTDAATSLQSSIDFDDLQLQEVIGGGGFGQVWKANWRGTPVAVKILTGAAQKTHIAKAILEEFKAEINLLKGMRHPNICLYMGACLTPPNRAIITELAANGSAWDSLRLPLLSPYTVSDGTSQGSWPIRLYVPGDHGAPPRSYGSSPVSAPIPPRGTWPFELVKRVSCGAARGMAYLHSGNPPVLHRDLKSANLLLDESYTTKVCDFGLSRLKDQARSMTANCGTVQWMAPEVLANGSYDEKADVYSFGIIVWELLTRECPYEGMSPIQVALSVLNRDKRPQIPKWCPPQLHSLIKSCIKKDPSKRPVSATF